MDNEEKLYLVQDESDRPYEDGEIPTHLLPIIDEEFEKEMIRKICEE